MIIPSSVLLPVAPYRELLGDVPVVVTRRRERKLLLASPRQPYVVASRPAQKLLLSRIPQLAPDATGVVVFSYKSWRIGEAVARTLGVPAVLRQHNLEGAYHRSLAQGTPGARGLVLRIEAQRIERDERRLEKSPWLTAMADISATDAEERRQRGARAIHIPPFAYDAALLDLPRSREQRPRVLFVGTLDVATNVTALHWFLDGVWPSIRAQVPEAVLDVVGRGPTDELVSRLRAEPGVTLHADVPDIHPFLAGAAVAVNPAVSGSGVNIKLVDYLQAGIPVVSTTKGAESLALVGDNLLIRRDEPHSFAEAVTGLLNDTTRAEEMASTARGRIAELLSPTTNIQRLEDALTQSEAALTDAELRPGSKPALSVESADLDWLSGPGREAWDTLFEKQAGVANPFCAPEWVETWYRHFTESSDRRLLVVHRNDELIGVAPFYRERAKVGRAGVATRLRLVGAGQGGSLLELPQVLAAPGHSREVLRAVVAATIKLPGPSVDWAEITVTADQGWFEPEWSYSTGEPVAFYRPQLARASVVLPLAGDWEATRSGLKRNLKESLRRSRNRLTKDGRPWSIETLGDDLDETAVEMLLALHRKRSRHDASVVHNDAYAAPCHQAFLREVLPKLGRRGRAALVALHLDGKMVAVQLALFAPGVAYLHSSGVDPDAWSLGPVTFLQEHVVKEASQRGDNWVNFSPGPNVAKLRWSEKVDLHFDFAYGSGGPLLQWRYGAFAAAQAMGQVRHAVSVAGAHQAPARAGEPAGSNGG